MRNGPEPPRTLSHGNPEYCPVPVVLRCKPAGHRTATPYPSDLILVSGDHVRPAETSLSQGPGHRSSPCLGRPSSAPRPRSSTSPQAPYLAPPLHVSHVPTSSPARRLPLLHGSRPPQPRPVREGASSRRVPFSSENPHIPMCLCAARVTTRRIIVRVRLISRG